jgi:hypothetical protein
MIYRLYSTNIINPENLNAAMTVGVNPQVSFVFDPANTDYQQYLKWLAEGNEPLPADEGTQ